MQISEQFFQTKCWFCLDVRVFPTAVDWIILEFGSIWEISDGMRNPAMCGFCREHFQMDIKSFQALSHILSQIYLWLLLPSSSLPIAIVWQSNCSTWCNLLLWLLLPDTIFIGICTCLCYVEQYLPHRLQWLTHFMKKTQCMKLIRDQWPGFKYTER